MMKSKPLSILLADDDQDDCYFFDNALKELSIDVGLEIVSDSNQLMQSLACEAIELPDVLFLGINMPRKNGTDCLVEINQIEKTQK